jgi:hypothetical protein
MIFTFSSDPNSFYIFLILWEKKGLIYLLVFRDLYQNQIFGSHLYGVSDHLYWQSHHDYIMTELKQYIFTSFCLVVYSPTFRSLKIKDIVSVRFRERFTHRDRLGRRKSTTLPSKRQDSRLLLNSYRSNVPENFSHHLLRPEHRLRKRNVFRNCSEGNKLLVLFWKFVVTLATRLCGLGWFLSWRLLWC